jgi:hypothetical protein
MDNRRKVPRWKSYDSGNASTSKQLYFKEALRAIFGVKVPSKQLFQLHAAS